MGGDIPDISEYFSGENALDMFVSNAADYTVLMYVLGVGGRHGDNMMLHRDGRFFQIDFGGAFGNHPDWVISHYFAGTTLGVSREMIHAMGGLKSEPMLRFKSRFLST